MKAVKKKLWTGWIRIQKILTEKDGISTVELILVLVGILTPYYALIKLLDEWEYENDTWIDDDGRLERWLVEFQKHAPTKEKREKLRKMIDSKYKKRGLPYPTEADFD